MNPSPTVADAHPDPKVRGSALLEALERPFLHLERISSRILPDELNPIARSGAIAVLTFLVACVSGTLVLIWYSPSVHGAYASMQAMEAAPLGAGLIRSLHRYSSDACLFFALMHGLRLFLGRRFVGARWLAWVTGLALIGLLWLVGWLGYWLVWDERAQLVAQGTARMLDGIPIFADSLSRSFLADVSVNSLLFFVVFFAHMLLPLAMALPLWLHVTRLARPKFLPRLTLGSWVVASLVLVSVLLPAQAASPARLLHVPEGLSGDLFFLLPILLTERLSGGLLWALLLGIGLPILALPFWASRGRARAVEVHSERCNSCTLCVRDCPYDAVRMVPRTDDRPYPAVALVDPDRCVGCGICVGSCDSAAIALPQLPILPLRKQIDQMVEQLLAAGERPHLAFACASSAASTLHVDPTNGSCAELPGIRVLSVPCAGWVERAFLERAAKHGAASLTVIGCGEGDCAYREGAGYTRARLDGTLDPVLRKDKIGATELRLLQLDKTRKAALLRALEGPRPQETSPARSRRTTLALGGAMGIIVLGGAVALGSDLPLAQPPASTELVVSFKHPGATGEHCRDVPPEELAKQPPHMRQARVCERGRAPVRLRVEVDGVRQLERAYEPRGLSRDGNSIAVERISLAPGRHKIAVAIGETGDPAEFQFRDEREVRIESNARQVILFDRLSGFTWHGDQDPAPATPSDRPGT